MILVVFSLFAKKNSHCIYGYNCDFFRLQNIKYDGNSYGFLVKPICENQ